MEYKNLVLLVNEYRLKNLRSCEDSRLCVELINFINTYKKSVFNSCFTNGHITAGGIVVCGDYVLLNHHKKLNKWIGFGGHPNAGETNPFLIALRETVEESGIKNLTSDARLFDIAKFNFKHNSETAHLHYDFRFVFKTDKMHSVKSTESNALKWFKLSDAIQMITDEATRRTLIKYCLIKEQENSSKNNDFEK